MRPQVSALLWAVALLLIVSSAASFAQNCCINVGPGDKHPADHNWQYDPADPGQFNLMMHARLCLPTSCPTGMPIRGVALKAFGSGNDLTDLDEVRVWLDTNCDGTGDVLLGSAPGYPADDGTRVFCSTNAPYTLAPGQCVCIVVEYKLKPSAPCGATYGFTLQGVLGNNCQSLPMCSTEPFRSAVKTVVCDDCCLRLSYGPNQPADHNFDCAAGTQSRPNFMMHARICNPCPETQQFYGLTLQFQGSGNPASVGQVYVFRDANCDGIRDSAAPILQGTFPAGGGDLRLCSPTGGPLFQIPPGQCSCLLIYFRMDCPPAPGTYAFEVTNLLGPNCEPVCAEGTPLKSAVKTVGEDPCCVKATRGPGFPADHTFTCVPGTPVKPNLMGVFQLCNPCDDKELAIGGLVLQAGGTGNDLTGIDKILVSLDYDCDGKPDSVNVLTGSYSADNGTVTLCNPAGGPVVVLPPGRCVCVRVEYIMKCPAPFGTYSFSLTQVLGPDCKEICAEVLPLRSAVKTVVPPTPCCPEVSYGPANPADHVYTCPATGGTTLNFMQQVRICNPCPTPMPIHGVRLKAYGTGNDQTGILEVRAFLDSNCDGQPDVPGVTIPAATYSADNGTALICSTGVPIVTLQPGQCICLNIYYRMKCPNPVPGTYQFEMTEILGPHCQPICDYGLPLKSAIKTIEPQPCCLRVLPGPKNPPSHKWGPWMPKRNTMFQFQVCNPCETTSTINCITLKAGGTGHDVNDIVGVRVFRDTNCDGVWQATDPLVGSGVYSGDNGTLTITPGAPIPVAPNQCVCFLVEYVMKNAGANGATYFMTLTDICAKTPDGQDKCVLGTPLTSNVKTRCLLIGEAKHVPIGSTVCLPQKIITAKFPDRIYIEELYMGPKSDDPDAELLTPSRASGIAVIGGQNLPVGPTGGSVVDVFGIVEMIGCEVVIRPHSIDITDTTLPAVQSLGMNNKTTGGEGFGNQSGVVDSFFDVFFATGLNNVGLLVNSWGNVVSVGPDSFYINDGSNLVDGTLSPFGFPNRGLRVDASQAGWVPPLDSTVRVTGILRAEPNQGTCIRSLMPRVRGDIELLAP